MKKGVASADKVNLIFEIHSKKYIDSCDLCNKNLCEKCKLYHFHIVKEQNHVILDEEKLRKYIYELKKGEQKNEEK